MADKLGLFYHEQVGLPIRIAGTVGITGAAFLAGKNTIYRRDTSQTI